MGAMNQPASTAQTPYEALGGRPVIERIVDRFYDLMDQDPAYRELRNLHAADLAPMRASLTGFLVGWAGGPRDWFEANPGECMMSAHKDIPVNSTTAGQWADAMRRAIADCPPENGELGDELAKILSQLSMGMVRD